MSDIDISNMDSLAWVLVAACIVVAAGFLFFVWRWIDKRKDDGGES